MILGYQELEDKILTPLMERIRLELFFANRTQELESFLKKYHLESEALRPKLYQRANVKILVIGDLAVSKDALLKQAKALGMFEKRFDFVAYDEAKHFDFKHLRHSRRYSDVFIGPVPHKVTSLNDASSILQQIRKTPQDYPKLHELIDSNGLRINVQSFRNALYQSRLYQLLFED